MNTPNFHRDIITYLRADLDLTTLLGGADKIHDTLALDYNNAPLLVYEFTPDASHTSAIGSYESGELKMTIINKTGDAANTHAQVATRVSVLLSRLKNTTIGNSYVVSACPKTPWKFHIDNSRQQVSYVATFTIFSRNTPS